jgi:hypothetical protein
MVPWYHGTILVHVYSWYMCTYTYSSKYHGTNGTIYAVLEYVRMYVPWYAILEYFKSFLR